MERALPFDPIIINFKIVQRPVDKKSDEISMYAKRRDWRPRQSADENLIKFIGCDVAY